MSNFLLDPSYQESLIKKTNTQLAHYWAQFDPGESLKSRLSSEGLTAKELANKVKESSDSTMAIYLTSLAINICYVEDLILGKEEDELFEFFEKSDLAAFFLEVKGMDVISSSIESLSILTDYFMSLLKILSDPTESFDATFIPVPDLGDCKDKCYLGRDYYIDLRKVHSISRDRGVLHFEYNTDLLTKTTDKELIKKQLFLRNNNELEVLKKIDKSLDVLKALTPNLYLTFLNFTQYLVPLNEKGMVSYSSQYLPGFSSINFQERDFVDCLDDLIHENGHHFLNTILNHCELIIEDPTPDYFSPWRETKRPIRGIYHGVFTFYWALELFDQLSSHKEKYNYFTKEELFKIETRRKEEREMLLSCQKALSDARSDELITDEGWDLIEKVMELVKTKE